VSDAAAGGFPAEGDPSGSAGNIGGSFLSGSAGGPVTPGAESTAYIGSRDATSRMPGPDRERIETARVRPGGSGARPAA
jgi:hypothetical protein